MENTIEIKSFQFSILNSQLSIRKEGTYVPGAISQISAADL